jgi:hypothetical protein
LRFGYGFGVDINNINNDSSCGGGGGETDKAQEEIPPSTLGSSGIYRIDKFNKQM